MERWIELNNKVIAGNVVQPQHDKDALQVYFQEKVNPNTVFFHDLEEKIRYLTEHGLWDADLFARYTARRGAGRVRAGLQLQVPL